MLVSLRKYSRHLSNPSAMGKEGVGFSLLVVRLGSSRFGEEKWLQLSTSKIFEVEIFD